MMANINDESSGFCFEPETECVMPIDDIFAQPLPFTGSRKLSFEQRPSMEIQDFQISVSVPVSTAHRRFSRTLSLETPSNGGDRRFSIDRWNSMDAPTMDMMRRLSLESPLDADGNSIDDLGGEITNVYHEGPASGGAHKNVFDAPASGPGCKVSQDSNSSTPCSGNRVPHLTATEIKDTLQNCHDGPPDDSWVMDALPIHNAPPTVEPKNYFWNQQKLSSGLGRKDSVQSIMQFDNDDWKNIEAEAGSTIPGVPLSHDFNVTPVQPTGEPFTIEVHHTMWAGEDPAKMMRKGPKQRCRKNKKALYWTPEDHEKFLAGLDKFGLHDSLGPGGAELMSVYMGNRTILQIKSHFQKYLSDLANGKCPSPASAANRSASPASAGAARHSASPFDDEL